MDPVPLNSILILSFPRFPSSRVSSVRHPLAPLPDGLVHGVGGKVEPDTTSPLALACFGAKCTG